MIEASEGRLWRLSHSSKKTKRALSKRDTRSIRKKRLASTGEKGGRPKANGEEGRSLSRGTLSYVGQKSFEVCEAGRSNGQNLERNKGANKWQD